MCNNMGITCEVMISLKSFHGSLLTLRACTYIICYILHYVCVIECFLSILPLHNPPKHQMMVILNSAVNVRGLLSMPMLLYIMCILCVEASVEVGVEVTGDQVGRAGVSVT